MNKGDIMPDGSVFGETFSGDDYKGEHPRPRSGETYGQYYERCQKAVEKGFHLGDLGWGDWNDYCLGFPGNEAYMQNDIIE